MAKAMVTCKKCKKEFFSGLDIPENAKLSGNSHTCPHCKAAATYDQDDYRFVKPS